MLTHGIPRDFGAGAHLFIPPTAIGLGPSLYQVTQLRTDGVHCQESTGIGPVVLRVVRKTGAAFSAIPMDHLICAPLFHSHRGLPLNLRRGHLSRDRYTSFIFMQVPRYLCYHRKTYTWYCRLYDSTHSSILISPKNIYIQILLAASLILELSS